MINEFSFILTNILLSLIGQAVNTYINGKILYNINKVDLILHINLHSI